MATPSPCRGSPTTPRAPSGCSTRTRPRTRHPSRCRPEGPGTTKTGMAGPGRDRTALLGGRAGVGERRACGRGERTRGARVPRSRGVGTPPAGPAGLGADRRGLWLAGDFDAAARLYENIADDLVPGDNSGERADRAVFGLRAARCRLESDGDTGAAINVVTEAGYTAAALPEPYATQVETECREAAAHVSELLGTGHTDTNSGAAPERE